MRIANTKPLFAWDCLEDSPSLKTIQTILQSLPDAKLLEGLRRHRGRGRNDYPVHVLWGVVVLQIVLRHSDCEAVLGELRRNVALRRLIGAEEEDDVPKGWNVSRFLDVLGQERTARSCIASLTRWCKGWVWPCRTWAGTRLAMRRR